MNRVLKAQSAAVVGGREAAAVIRQLKTLKFAGDIWPVNPKRDEIEGIACYKSIADLPDAPDTAFVAVPRDRSVEIVRQLNERGAGGAVCYASGFAEVGAEGAKFEDDLVAAAGDMPLIGPNCYGFLNYLDRVAMWPDEHGGEPVDRGVAIVTQSGNMGMNITMQQRGLPLAGLYTLGNQADVGIAHMVDTLAKDERVTAIGLHVEGLADIAVFAQAATIARLHRTPIVVLKTGRSKAAARITESHTSSLAGPDRLYDALFEKYGVARVNTLTQLLETLKFLHFAGPLDGTRIASMSCSGGEAALVADMAEDLGLEFPPMTPEHADKVRATLSEFVDVSNPLDYHTFIWGDAKATTACFTAMLSGGYDAAMLIIDFPNKLGLDPAAWYKTIRALETAANNTKACAVVVATLPECLPATARKILSDAGIAPMVGLDDCLCAIAAAAKIKAGWSKPLEPTADLLAAPLADASGHALDEQQAKSWLQDYGVPIPNHIVCTAAGAVPAANKVGFPVVLKAVSAELTHKSEAGGVAVGLTDDESVAAAVERMTGLSETFLVEEMIYDGIAEFIVGVQPDAQFGPSLLVGAGGVLTELMRDSVPVLLPCTKADIRNALFSLKASVLLKGFRGLPEGDVDALVDAIAAVARFATERHDIVLGLDVNPIIVRPKGQGVCAVDAWIKVTDEAETQQ